MDNPPKKRPKPIQTIEAKMMLEVDRLCEQARELIWVALQLCQDAVEIERKLDQMKRAGFSKPPALIT